ncbi:unnamed protein product [Pocillopora meandrina]|uniref:Uncharacterized protein n=1 Tax=Pocillopora meandrina TaxID=46732 RepID=A0AAU9WSF4_9CNID|nr:unnamed protein product [Pocillopora meandrina]
MRTILTPPKTMTICKLYGIYYHSALHRASVMYRLVCLPSINAGLFERFFDRIVDITRRMWSKHTEDLVLNAFLYILEEDITAEENTLRRESGELVYNKLHLSDDSPSAAEECQPEETDVTTKPQEEVSLASDQQSLPCSAEGSTSIIEMTASVTVDLKALVTMQRMEVTIEILVDSSLVQV